MCVRAHVRAHACACAKTINEAASDARAVLCLQTAAGGPESWASRGLRLTSTRGTGDASIPPAGLRSSLSSEDSENPTNWWSSLLLLASGLHRNILGHIGWSTTVVKGAIAENPDRVIKNRESRNLALDKRQKLGHQKLVGTLPPTPPPRATVFWGCKRYCEKLLLSDFNFYMCNQPFNFYKKFNSHSHAKNSHEENADQ